MRRTAFIILFCILLYMFPKGLFCAVPCFNGIFTESSEPKHPLPKNLSDRGRFYSRTINVSSLHILCETFCKVMHTQNGSVKDCEYTKITYVSSDESNSLNSLCNCDGFSSNDDAFLLLCGILGLFPTRFFELLNYQWEFLMMPIQVLASILALIGFIGNILTIYVILHSSTLSSPNHRLLLHLAIGDIFSLLIVYANTFTSLPYVLLLCVRQKYLYLTTTLLTFICQHNSAVQIVLLSILRYFQIVHPLFSRRVLTCNKVSISSVFGTFLGILISSAVLFPLSKVFYEESTSIFLKNLSTKITEFMFSSLFFHLYLTIIPTVLLLIFHFLKIKKVSSTKSCRDSTQHMYILVSAITFIYIAPAIVDLTFSALSLIMGMEWFGKHVLVYSSVSIFWLLRYGANPFIYFFLSPPGRQFCKKTAQIFSCFRLRTFE